MAGDPARRADAGEPRPFDQQRRLLREVRRARTRLPRGRAPHARDRPRVVPLPAARRRRPHERPRGHLVRGAGGARRRGPRVHGDAREPGRAGARPRTQLRVRADDRGDAPAQRPAGLASEDRERAARRPLSAGHRRGRRRRRLVRRRRSSPPAGWGSPWATSSARASSPRPRWPSSGTHCARSRSTR